MSSKQQAIAQLAYLLWESRGRQANSAERDWAEAEALLAARDRAPSELPSGGNSADRRKTDRKPRITTRRGPKRPAEKGSPPVE
jgi:hypothetical protein